MVAIHGS
ncbi:hypothetical protein MTR67_025648 [Solanum verrucosum]|nr:hypothetical protein MTR67_025648 [Solanum verrucosum]